MENYKDECSIILDSIVNLVRGQLSNLERITLGSLIVIQVHNKDIVNYLIEQNVKSKTDFEWISQMRYYYKMDNSINSMIAVSTITSELK